ncbi:chitinase-3-like protein 1 [Cephus cinctus]|uniref:chitinase n=1 Tax=Cephus cinctus TaxID=211228 RepID=A0AAJ7FIN5_CEPCN|nr:chitinase-3-like protein 1 [Cephus cinctus]
MRAWTVFLAISVALAAAKVQEHKIVCYFGSWSVYRLGNGKFDVSKIDPTLCTHMIYSFVGLTSNGEIKILDSWTDVDDGSGRGGFNKFNALREISSGTKTMLAIGGYSGESTTFSNVIKDPILRSKFVRNILQFVKKYNFDGFDVDWEYPAQRGGAAVDKENLVLLLKELRSVFDDNNLILSAAVAATESSARISYDIPSLSKYLDFINLMAYDFHGAWDKFAGHNAPLYAASWESSYGKSLNVNASVHYWLAQGAQAEKLILGTGFYGRSFTLMDPNTAKLGSAVIGPGNPGPYTMESGMLGYNEICELQMKEGWVVEWDNEQNIPYAHLGNQWVGYDDAKSLTEKANFVKKHGLGGAMLWSIETDDFNGICGDKYPLLKALNNILRDDSDSSNDIESTTGPSTTVTNTGNTQESAPGGAISDICAASGFIRDPNNCRKFYLCQKVYSNNYQVIELNCAVGLYFDTKLNVCNYQNLVEC